MASKDDLHDKLMSRFGYQPPHIMNGMIPTMQLDSMSGVEWRTSANASIGDLDTLPLELLQRIFAMLDLQTLSRVKCSCSRGIEVVESLVEYRNLRRFASQTMLALGSTKLSSYHSVQSLHAALCSEACSSCGHYGPFLFLPTAERCCYECLFRNQSLWMITLPEAQLAFDLSAASVKKLPILHSLPGRYYVRYSITRKRRWRLVNVRAAKELAVKQGKSTAYLVQDLEARRASGLSLEKYYKVRWLQAAPLQAPGYALALQPSQANVPNDKFCGTASVPFPSLMAGKRIENGQWCLGCAKLCREWSPNKPHEALSHLITLGPDMDRNLQTMQHIARSEAEFVKHIEHCVGAKEMAPEIEAGLQHMVYS